METLKLIAYDFKQGLFCTLSTKSWVDSFFCLMAYLYAIVFLIMTFIIPIGFFLYTFIPLF